MDFKDFTKKGRSVENYWDLDNLTVITTRIHKDTRVILDNFKKYANRMQTNERIMNQGIIMFVWSQIKDDSRVKQEFKDFVLQILEKNKDEIEY